MTYTPITILNYRHWHIYKHQLWFTYFIVRQESSGSSGIASFSPSVCRCVQTMVTVIGQAEWLSIHGHSHHNLFGVCSSLNPVVDGEILENWKQCQYFAILQLKNQIKHLQSQLSVVTNCSFILQKLLSALDKKWTARIAQSLQWLGNSLDETGFDSWQANEIFSFSDISAAI